MVSWDNVERLWLSPESTLGDQRVRVERFQSITGPGSDGETHSSITG